jgi:hypothetical protein
MAMVSFWHIPDYTIESTEQFALIRTWKQSILKGQLFDRYIYEHVMLQKNHCLVALEQFVQNIYVKA